MIGCAVAFLFIVLLNGFEGFGEGDRTVKAAGLVAGLFLILSVGSVLIEAVP